MFILQMMACKEDKDPVVPPRAHQSLCVVWVVCCIGRG